MIDQKDSYKRDEEYQFQEDSLSASDMHASASTDHKTVKKGSVFERINRRHLILGVIGVFLVYGVYKLGTRMIHAIVSGSHHVTKNHSVLPKSNALGTSMAVPLPPPPTPEEVIRDRLDQLVKGESDLQSVVHALTSQISDIQTSLSNLSNQLTETRDELKNLQLGQEVLIQKQTRSARAGARKSALQRAIYYVRAIIPGRVWFTTQEGTTLTLGVGDHLAGYGTIESINPEQGVVSFSSGAVIGYNPEDR